MIRWLSILILNLAIPMLFFACADSNFMDKTAIASSVLKGEKVLAKDELAQNSVLITQRLVIKGNAVSLFGICSGVIVTPRIILTAAHCLDNRTPDMKVILNVDARQELSEKDNVYSVVDAEVHFGYRTVTDSELSLHEKKRNPDLALLYLDREIKGISSAPFTIAKSDLYLSENENIDLTISGYGKTSALLDTSSISFQDLNGTLRKAKLKLTTKSIRQSHFTIDQSSSRGICDGDSGAGAYVEMNKQLKLFALAIGTYRRHSELDSTDRYSQCAGHGVFIKLQAYQNWIESTARDITSRNKNN